MEGGMIEIEKITDVLVVSTELEKEECDEYSAYIYGELQRLHFLSKNK